MPTTNTTTPDPITVELGGGVRVKYPHAVAALGEWLAQGGRITTIKALARIAASDDAITEAEGWVDLDSSGLVYRVSVRASGHYRITGASPYYDRTVRPVYLASGEYGAE